MSRLYFLVPGVQATGTTAASEQPQDIYRPSIGGQYWGGINFQLDGTDNRESVLGEPVITPNLDAGGPSFAPDIAIPFRASDYFARHDPVFCGHCGSQPA